MEPIAVDLCKLAMYDPVAAYGIFLGIPRLPFLASITAAFSSFTIPQNPVTGDLDSTISQRTWIQKIDYTVRCPNVFSGSLFKPEFDTNLRESPGIDVILTVHSGPRYPISPHPVPLENLRGALSSFNWPAGWPLFKQQSIEGEFMLRQAPGGAPAGPPYTVILTFTGWQFLDPTLDEISGTDAAAALRDAGLDIPDWLCKPRSLRR